MKVEDVHRRVFSILASISIVLAVTSCNNGSEADVEGSKGIAGGECPTNAVVAVEEQKALTQVERLESECRRLVVGPEHKLRGKDVLLAINELCKEIRNLPREEALPLLDRWIEMAIAQLRFVSREVIEGTKRVYKVSVEPYDPGGVVEWKKPDDVSPPNL